MIARTAIVTVPFTLLLITAAGCMPPDPKDRQIAFLTRDKNNLVVQNDQLSTEIKTANTQLAKATADIALKERELTATQAKIIELEKRIGQPAPPPPAPGQPAWIVAGDVLFSAGKATLNAQRIAELDRIVEAVKNSGQGIQVIGHTDSDPIVRTAKIWRDNHDLSNARALAVKQYLVSRGLDGATIYTLGMGADQPVASNATRTGKAQNRRVEIRVVR